MNRRLFQSILQRTLAVADAHGVREALVPFPPTFRRDPIFRTRGFWGRSYDPDPILQNFSFESREESRILAARLSWLHAWVWRTIRAAGQTPGSDGASKVVPHESREALEAWAKRHALSALLNVRGKAIGVSDRSCELWTCGDVLAPSPLWALGEPPHLVREWVAAKLSEAQSEAARGTELEAARQGLHATPSAKLRAAMLGLREVRAGLRSGVAPRSSAQNDGFKLKVVQEGAFVFKESSPRLCGDCRTGAELTVSRSTAGSWAVECDCEYGGEQPCAAKLAAVDALLDLAVGDGAAQCASHASVIEQLQRAPWQKSVDELVRALSARSIPEEVDGLPAHFGWELSWGTSHWDTRLYPVLVRPRKRGDGETFKRIPMEQWDEAALELGGVDALVLRSLNADERPSAFNHWEAVSPLLVELAGSSNIYMKEGSVRQIAVRAFRATAQLDTADGRLHVHPTFGDTSPPSDVVDEALRDPGRWVPHWVARGRELQLFNVPPRVARAVDVVSRGDGFDGEAAAAALEQAAPLFGAGQVVPGESIRGEQWATHTRLAVDLEVDGGVLYVRLRAMPIDGGATFPVGEGPERVFGAQDGVRYFVVRDFADEYLRAETIARRIELSDEEGFEWAFPMGEQSLDLVERLQSLNVGDEVVVRWRSKPVKVAGSVSATSLTLEVGTLKAWLSIGGTARVDGVGVPIEQLIVAAREGKRWVQLEGGYAKIDEALRRKLAGVAGTRVSALAAPLLVDLEDAGAEIIGTDDWRTIDRKIRESVELAPEIPDALDATLRAYQREGFAWMSRLAHWAPGAVLADDMGLGKTIQALTLLLSRREHGPALVIAPTSLGFNWQREAQRFAPSLDVRLMQSGDDVSALEDLRDDTLVVTSYGLAARNQERIGEVAWGTLIFDEAQALKNPATQRAKAARAIDAKFTVALTGTPVENRTEELWSIFRVVVPGLLGSRKDFRRRFGIPIERHRDERASRALAALTSPFVLRRLKRDVATELPERLEVRLDIELQPTERRVYDGFRADFLQNLKSRENLERFEVLAAITRLRQLACHVGLVDPAFVGGSSKISMLTEQLDALRREGQRALVFSQFTSLLDLVEPVLKDRGLRLLRIDGTTPAPRRGALVDRFQAGDADVFLLSTKAGGQGLNLTAATAVFHLDPWWNPAVEDQATDRAYRIGQLEPVTVYRMVAVATIEEAIYELHETKRELVDSLLAGGASNQSLTPEELRALIEGQGRSAAARKERAR